MGKNTSSTPVEPVAVDVENTPETEAAAAVETPAEVIPSADPEPAAAPALVTHEIAAGPEKGFYRAGRYWPRAGLTVNRAEFTDDQWAALEGEPKLTIKPL